MRISDWSSDVCSSDLTTINANDQLRSIQDYEQLIVAYENGAPLRLRDVADARQDAENIRQAAWIGTTPAILLNIQREPRSEVRLVGKECISTYRCRLSMGHSKNT